MWKYLTVLRHSRMFFVIKFELILIIGSNNVLKEGARKFYRGRRVGQGWAREPILPVTGYFSLSFTSRFNSIFAHTEHTQTSMPKSDLNPRSQCWSGPRYSSRWPRGTLYPQKTLGRYSSLATQAMDFILFILDGRWRYISSSASFNYGNKPPLLTV
jgi:hypothetical protein